MDRIKAFEVVEAIFLSHRGVSVRKHPDIHYVWKRSADFATASSDILRRIQKEFPGTTYEDLGRSPGKYAQYTVPITGDPYPLHLTIFPGY